MNTKSKALIVSLVLSVGGWIVDALFFSGGAAPADVTTEVATAGASSASAGAKTSGADDRLIAMRAAVAKHLDELAKDPSLVAAEGADGFGMPASWTTHAGVAAGIAVPIDASDVPGAPKVSTVMTGIGAIVNGKLIKIGGLVDSKGSVIDAKALAQGGKPSDAWTLIRVTRDGAEFRSPEGRSVLVAPPVAKLESGEIELKPAEKPAAPAAPATKSTPAQPKARGR